MLSRDDIPRSPVLGGYRAVNPILYAYLRAWDVTLAPLCWLSAGKKSRTLPLRRAPKRLLIANCAHLGDVVLATSVLPVLKTVFPGVSIGFLCGGWAREMLEGHALLDRIHTVDHWKLDRSGRRQEQKLVRYIRTRRHAIREIRAAGYDAAIDLYYFYPNAADILWAADIPVRIGFTSGGFGGLYTHPVVYKYQPGHHMSDYHADLLRSVGVGNEHLANMRPMLAGVAATTLSPGCEPKSIANKGQDYVLIHMGIGNRAREWPVAKWRALTSRLHAAGYRMVFTGRGTRERRLVGLVTEHLDGCVDLCDRLDLPEYVTTVERASVAVVGESLAVHVAAAVGTPSVVIAPGIDIDSWWPVRANARLLTQPVRCSPCFVGCPGMECVREVEVNSVYRAIEQSLENGVSRRMVTG